MTVQKFKLANILLDDIPEFLSTPALLCRSTALYHRVSRGSDEWAFEGPGTHDFTTFFNALSVRKWRSYTVAGEFWLHLEMKGAACEIVQTRADAFSWDTEVVENTRQRTEPANDWHSVEIRLIGSTDDVIEAFELIISGDDPVLVRNAYYYTFVDESAVRPVELALCTTTFKKESFIEHNIDLVKTGILASDEPIARHFTQHVVDNGRTLDVDRLQGPCVRIHPQGNVGGSGGYARGMIEAMEQTPKATHVLLMDDDVVISPESIIRTFNLLSIVNDEHVDDFVSGGMMNLFEPDTLWEDIGYVTADGECLPLKRPSHMGLLHEVASSETYMPHPEYPGHEHESQTYAGWWYCVIPMKVIEANGLPLPVFVRYDDIEYALRCRAKFMTMNGICLWHPSFLRRYNAAVERYQVIRNSNIGKMTTNFAPMTNFEKKLYHAVQLEMKKFNYTNASLALDGFEDFLKGPGFLMDPKNVEKGFMDANKNAEKLVPFDELRRQAKEQGIDLTDVQEADSQKNTDMVEIRSYPQRIQDFITFNGQRFDFGYVQRNTYAIIDVAGWLYPSDRIRRKDTIIAVDLENQRGVIRHMDKARFDETWKRYKRDIKFFEDNKERLQKEYSQARDKFISVDFWKGYLGID